MNKTAISTRPVVNALRRALKEGDPSSSRILRYIHRAHTWSSKRHGALDRKFMDVTRNAENVIPLLPPRLFGPAPSHRVAAEASAWQKIRQMAADAGARSGTPLVPEVFVDRIARGSLYGGRVTVPNNRAILAHELGHVAKPGYEPTISKSQALSAILTGSETPILLEEQKAWRRGSGLLRRNWGHTLQHPEYGQVREAALESYRNSALVRRLENLLTRHGSLGLKTGYGMRRLPQEARLLVQRLRNPTEALRGV